MSHFPAFISIEGKECLVVGGGRVAFRKCKGLLAFGASVCVIAPELTEAFELLKKEQDAGESTGRLRYEKRKILKDDLLIRKWALVVAATNDRMVNERVAAFCHQREILVNVADNKEACTFFFPAYCKQEEVAVGITTSGTSPKMASFLRKKLQEQLPDWIKEAKESVDE
jgi:precorrin-2 dehydrogenase / sirohydrochlorin ferrochelatase